MPGLHGLVETKNQELKLKVSGSRWKREYSNTSINKVGISTFYFIVTLLSLVKITIGVLKMCSSKICVGHCRSSIKRIGWFKPHLRMSSPRTIPSPILSFPLPGEAGCCRHSAILAYVCCRNTPASLSRLMLRSQLNLPRTLPDLTQATGSSAGLETPLRRLLIWQRLCLFRWHGSREEMTRVSQTLCCQEGCTKKQLCFQIIFKLRYH